MNLKTLTTAAFSALLCVIASYGQPLPGISASIPFGFSVESGKTLPAGTYTFKYDAGGRTILLSGTGSASNLRLPVLTTLSPQSFAEASLVFDESGGTPTISEIWIPKQDGILVHAAKGAHKHRSVLAVVSGGEAKGSGKEIFASTCARCHGPQGKGNAAADKFFNTPIPRLGSTVVQSKSDAELREIITQGRRNMDPVRMSQAGVRHLLQPEAVNAVVAYVRTLKQ